MNRCYPDPEKPVLEWSGAELRPIIGAQVFRFATAEQQRIKRLKDFGRAHPGGNLHAQRFAGIFVENGQHLVGSTVTQLVVDKVDRPDMVWIKRSQADNRRIVMIKSLAAFMPMRQLQAFFTPDPLDFLVIDDPAFGSQELTHLPVPVAAVLFGEPDQGQTQVVFMPRDGLIAQAAAGNAEDLTGPPFGCPEPLPGLTTASFKTSTVRPWVLKNRGSP